MSYLSELLGEAYKEGMTADEISEALETKKVGNNESEITRLKNALNKANSEAAEYKKQIRQNQSEEDRKAAEQKEEYEKIVKENADLKRSMNISAQKAKLIGLGYEEKLAEETATAMIDGDVEKIVSNQGIFLEAVKKNQKVTDMKNTPRPAAGGSDGDNGGAMNYDDLISKAQAEGNWANAAYYQRLKAMNEAESQP